MLSALIRVIRNKPIKFGLSVTAVILATVNAILTRSGGGVGGEIFLLIAFIGYWGYQLDVECDVIDQEEACKRMIKRNQVI